MKALWQTEKAPCECEETPKARDVEQEGNARELESKWHLVAEEDIASSVSNGYTHGMFHSDEAEGTASGLGKCTPVELHGYSCIEYKILWTRRRDHGHGLWLKARRFWRNDTSAIMIHAVATIRTRRLGRSNSHLSSAVSDAIARRRTRFSSWTLSLSLSM